MIFMPLFKCFIATVSVDQNRSFIWAVLQENKAIIWWKQWNLEIYIAKKFDGITCYYLPMHVIIIKVLYS
jgi:hypothetical protein